MMCDVDNSLQAMRPDCGPCWTCVGSAVVRAGKIRLVAVYGHAFGNMLYMSVVVDLPGNHLPCTLLKERSTLRW